MAALRSVLETLRLLEPVEVLGMAQVCRLWRQAVDSEELWAYFCACEGYVRTGKEGYKQGVRLSRTMAFLRGLDLYLVDFHTGHREMFSLAPVELPCSQFFSLLLPSSELALLGGCYLEPGKGCARPMLISSKALAVRENCRSLGTLRKSRCLHSAILFDGCIYVFGGVTTCTGFRDSELLLEKSCECLSLAKDRDWRGIQPMLEGRYEFTVSAYRRYIYLCGGHQLTMERFQVDSGHFQLLSMSLSQEIWGTVLISGQLILLNHDGYQQFSLSAGNTPKQAWKSNDTTSRLSQCPPTANLIPCSAHIYQLSHDCVFLIDLKASSRSSWPN